MLLESRGSLDARLLEKPRTGQHIRMPNNKKLTTDLVAVLSPIYALRHEWLEILKA